MRLMPIFLFIARTLIGIRLNDPNQYFYELKQCHKNNWIQKNGLRKTDPQLHLEQI